MAAAGSWCSALLAGVIYYMTGHGLTIAEERWAAAGSGAPNFVFHASSDAFSMMAGQGGMVQISSTRCPHAAAGFDDGCKYAGAGAPPYPMLLDSYGTRRPPFDVAGVDYSVGVAPGTLLDPSEEPLPAGCSYSRNIVTCQQSNTVLSGYDFSLHKGIQLIVGGGATNVTIRDNKFALGPNCKDPVININAGGFVMFSHNSIDGNGALCGNRLVFGSLINGVYRDGATLTVDYNLFYDTPVDITDNRGPDMGAARIVNRYNLFYLQGFSGHPDGIQLNGGNFDLIDVSFNTYYNRSPPSTVGGTQPFHIEAQLTAAIRNSTVSYNTILTPGACRGGRNWPNGCAANFDIACKNDQVAGWIDSNTNFSAFGNYIDWSGAIAALFNNCGTGATWGKPTPNLDLNTGATLVP